MEGFKISNHLCYTKPMSINREQGIKARDTNYERYGADFYKHMGALGGKSHSKGGFKDRALAARAGRLGGLVKKGKRLHGLNEKGYTAGYVKRLEREGKSGETTQA